MGVGVYLVWPAFYCDVTDAYRLDRRGRLRTDLGGVYFNGIFALLAGAAYFATGQEALLLVAFVQHTIVLQQLLPLLRFDGYYVLSDLTGVPDILSRIKPIFRVARARRASREPRVESSSRGCASSSRAYLLRARPDAGVHDRLDGHGGAAHARDRVRLARAAARPHPRAPPARPRWRSARSRCGALVLPLGGDRGEPEPQRADGDARAAGVVGGQRRRGAPSRWPRTAAVAGGAAYTWWPNGDYQPIRPGERGTVGEALASRPRRARRAPLVDAARQRQFGPVPTARGAGGGAAARRSARPPE